MREACLIVATGVKGSGKTYTTLWKEVIPYAKGFYNGKKRPVLIFDHNNEYSWSNDSNSNIYPKTPRENKITKGKPIRIKTIDLIHVHLLSNDHTGEIRRFAPFYTADKYDKKGNLLAYKGDLMSHTDLKLALLYILRTFHNGMLIIEDLRGIFGNHIPLDVSSAITRNRHKNLDIVWHLQSVGRMLPEYWENTNYIRFHKENNSIENAEQKLPDINLFRIAENLVENEYKKGNKYYYVYVNLDRYKIEGEITKNEAIKAIDQYLKADTRTIRSLLAQKNEHDGKMYTFNQAIEERTKQFYNKYIAA